MAAPLPFRISTLIFIRNDEDQLLLLQRNRMPNQGLWSPIGGKLNMDQGESPFECAIRETHEEIGLKVSEKDLHLFAMISEKSYEGTGHWLMFLFDCHRPIQNLPAVIEEGKFSFFAPDRIKEIPVPETDRNSLWDIYFNYRQHFVAMRANCIPEEKLEIYIEEIQ